ncbi:MAG: 3-isopropylmalate dehydratase small subunit [Dehalococcoidia bacterium]|nr:3-isopropylmalate dehydratase small subunit [Dehalococcoidia bacterium]
MEPYVRVTGIVAPLDRPNVDTDQIIPAVYLKRIERTGFGQFLFNSWRKLPNGRPNPEFVLNNPRYRGATILVAGPNFGSGSSREHAPWALQDFGFRTIIAPSFADIFRNNCYQNGMLPVVLPQTAVDHIMEKAKTVPGYQVTVDLERCLVTDSHEFTVPFEIDAFRRHCLLRGLDEIGLTLEHQDKIASYERTHAIS